MVTMFELPEYELNSIKDLILQLHQTGSDGSHADVRVRRNSCQGRSLSRPPAKRMIGSENDRMAAMVRSGAVAMESLYHLAPLIFANKLQPVWNAAKICQIHF